MKAVGTSAVLKSCTGGILAVLLNQSVARAEDCTTPACHLATGKLLLKSDPKRAAAELLASYKLDERTDTLILYAGAVERDRQYALAVETWERIATYRESELTAAKETGNRAAIAKAQKQSKQATDAIAKLSPNVARVRIKFAAGPKPVVTRDGVEVDAMHEVVVIAGHDELVFSRADGSADRLPITMVAGDNVRIDAPEPAAKPAPVKPKVETTKPPEPEIVKQSPPEMPAKPEEAVKPLEPSLTSLRYTDEPRSRTMSRIGIGLVAGAVVAGGIAGSFGYLANRDFDRAQNAGCDSNGECQAGTPGVDLAERSNDRARLAQISAIGAGALLATGVTLYIMGNKKTRAATDVSLRLAPSSATLAWRF